MRYQITVIHPNKETPPTHEYTHTKRGWESPCKISLFNDLNGAYRNLMSMWRDYLTGRADEYYYVVDEVE